MTKEFKELIRRLRWEPAAEVGVPEAQRDDAAFELLKLGSWGPTWHNVQIAENAGALAGPRTAQALRLLFLEYPILLDDADLVGGFIRVEGLRALEFLTFEVPPDVEIVDLRKVRPLIGGSVRPSVWDLYIEEGGGRRWPALQKSGFAFTAEEFRACARRYESWLPGLVFEIRAPGQAPRWAAAPFEIEDGAEYSVAHPATTPKEHQSEGGPFDQWAIDTGRVEWAGRPVSPVRLLLKLEAREWRRTPPGVDGCLRRHERPFPDLGLRAILEYDGLPLRDGDWRAQTIRAIRYEPHAHPIAEAGVHEDLRALYEA
jgi:hypothetical protein